MLERWGGVECTVTRVGSAWRDQIARSGWTTRAGAIDRIASLGLSALRYPVIWERMDPDHSQNYRWHDVDDDLARLRELGIAPIIGLLHHGTGPMNCDILSDDFPASFARYAGAVARRFPWVEWWLPVNEPVTTARFAGLYGHWYPHLRDGRAFVRLLLQQCRAILLAQQAIRAVIPRARFLHTEDAGRITATRTLQYQADFENARQLLAIDLVSARVDAGHDLWPFLSAGGMSRRERDWFAANACDPACIGADYYPTSDRFLDHDTREYGGTVIGGNGRHAYVDVCSSSKPDWLPGIAGTVASLASRYDCDVAIGELHRGGSPELQCEWIRCVWEIACQARAADVPLVAVTFWALLGAYDWDSLLVQASDYYEPGAFDTRVTMDSYTAVGDLIASLGAAQSGVMPAVSGAGGGYVVL